ncbi:GNAT family N-acetyltransferase [Salinibacterium sp. SYSU T00001]|uniref:GNAT family N-acetyltransferase n=1 Tax=Homoserinimonas sedimenticola TaxID=2986805 RepID=UPI0022365465|nr:GNAT family N-acetyltransferase [Salinibacterium sedimenticola]MCW4386046.1 GNAT family N-acetyltransferase [Salinibacterium sedimenticola]
MGEFRMEELSASNVVAANSLTLKPGQEQFIAPVTYAMADPFLDPTTTWSRVAIDSEGDVVGFLLANFDPDAMDEEFRSCIWRMNVAAEAQGRGVGRFIVNEAVAEARRRGFERLTVIWESGDEGPEEFFLHIGFRVMGETQYGEKIGAIET